jgi:bla regulator protein BlaR1
MSSNAKELKSRLQNMLFFKRNSGSRRIVSLVVSLLILVSGLTVACDVMPGDAGNINNSLVVYLKNDGLYFAYLDGGEEVKIQDGDSFDFKSSISIKPVFFSLLTVVILISGFK